MSYFLKKGLISKLTFPTFFFKRYLVDRAEGLRDRGSIPGLGRYPGVGNGNPLQDFCPENHMDRGA